MQIRIALATVGGVVLIILLGWSVKLLLNSQSDTESAAHEVSPEGIHLTDAQLANLTIQRVSRLSFRSERRTETTALAVPEDAVVYHGDTPCVWIIQQGNTAALREIRPGRSKDGMVEVLDGVNEGEQLITQGGIFIDRERSLIK